MKTLIQALAHPVLCANLYEEDGDRYLEIRHPLGQIEILKGGEAERWLQDVADRANLERASANSLIELLNDKTITIGDDVYTWEAYCRGEGQVRHVLETGGKIVAWLEQVDDVVNAAIITGDSIEKIVTKSITEAKRDVIDSLRTEIFWTIYEDWAGAELLAATCSETRVLATVFRVGKRGAHEFHVRLIGGNKRRGVKIIAKSREEAMKLCEKELGISKPVAVEARVK